MESLAGAAVELPAGVEEPKSEIGVLAEGAREALVKPTHLGESCSAVGHVRSCPTCALEPGDASLPVRRRPMSRQRHTDPSLGAGRPRASEVEVEGERVYPARPGKDVVVQKCDPLSVRAAPAIVSRPGRPALLHVLDHDHQAGEPRQALAQGCKRCPADGRDDDIDTHAAGLRTR
jgi:hypothetical protein